MFDITANVLHQYQTVKYQVPGAVVGVQYLDKALPYPKATDIALACFSKVGGVYLSSIYDHRYQKDESSNNHFLVTDVCYCMVVAFLSSKYILFGDRFEQNMHAVQLWAAYMYIFIVDEDQRLPYLKLSF